MENKSLIQNISQIYRTMQYQLEMKMKKYDLENGLYVYLSHLLLNGEMNQQSLAKAVNRDQAPTARAVERLISMEYLEKKLNENDKRSNQLKITPKAENIKQDIIKIIQSCENDSLKAFSLEEKQLFLALCQKISNYLVKE